MENSHAENIYMYITGNPKSGSELSNNNINGMLKAISISMAMMMSFCSCLFFIVGI